LIAPVKYFSRPSLHPESEPFNQGKDSSAISTYLADFSLSNLSFANKIRQSEDRSSKAIGEIDVKNTIKSLKTNKNSLLLKPRTVQPCSATIRAKCYQFMFSTI
jgi:hypothetical protein